MATGSMTKEINLIRRLIKEMNKNKIEFIKIGEIEIKKATNSFKNDVKLEKNVPIVITEEQKRKLEEEELFWSSSV
jgi:CO dehydrogenase/acetyl-CoA synthase delta subunit